MNNTATRSWRRAFTGALALQLALGPLATPAFAQATKLADEPIGFSPSAPPNVMLTVDDSTSMLSDFLPDYVIGNFCRDATGNMTVPCGYVGSATSPQYIFSAGPTTGSPNVPFPRYAAGYSASTLGTAPWPQAWAAPVHNNAVNRLYYDPAITYTPPLKYDGTPYPSQNKANTATWTSVVTDPWATTTPCNSNGTPSAAPCKYEDLTKTVRVGMWCNSDWPTNANWDPATGGGDHCRINGTNYATTPPTGPAANHSDYMYPWKKAAATADNAKYFWVNSATATATPANDIWRKTLWCDTNSPKWPRNLSACTTTYSCPVGQTYTPPPPLPQRCFDGGVKNGCIGPVTYTPAGCNTNPLYGSPGPCVGPECLVCTQNACPTGAVGRIGRCHLQSTGTGGSNANCDCNTAGCTVNPTHAACTPFPQTIPGTCSGGAVPTPTTTCPKLSNPSCNQPTYDPVAKTNTGPTLLADANGVGEVCRHNNQAYPDGTVASPFNYSAAHATYKTAISGSCPSVPGYANIPRHYWKVSVEWCKQKITATNDKWLGFGLPAVSECQDDHDSAHPYPRYYKWGVRKSDPEYLDNYQYPAFQRVDLDAVNKPSYTHNFYDSSGTAVTISRTWEQEMENYANWFSYYRTRIQAAKTVISQNFSFLDSGYRVGYHTLSNAPATSFVNIQPFDEPPTAGGQKKKWYDQLFATKIAMGQQTPNLDAVVRIGELFKSTSGHPDLAGSTDPIVLSCHKNYHMLFTDGITNQAALPLGTPPGNQDDTAGIPYDLPKATPPLTKGQPWPELYRENTAASLPNTMADYATYYWSQDLRTGMTDNVPIGGDPAPWQHLNFAALSLGTEGTLGGSGGMGCSSASVESQIAAGTLEWPKPIPNQWKPNATGVDDLWHAAVNGRGRFVNAKTSQQLGRGIAQILMDISSPSGSAAPPTFANPNISVTNDFSYISNFEPGWGGDLQKVQIDPSTAATIGQIWSAKTSLIAQVTSTLAIPKPWLTNRRVFTVNESGAAVPFAFANLGPAQKAALGSNSTKQNLVIEYLRGSRENEGDCDGQFRTRAKQNVLGDIVDSQAVMVGPTGPPLNDYWDYQDSNDPGYSAFKTAQKSRPTRIYVGSNDGMLHAFDDADGSEAWAFIPRDFFRDTSCPNGSLIGCLSPTPLGGNDKAGLIGLTYQPGGLPIYDHRFYVNSSPRVVDAHVGGSWKTMLVSGLGKGGKSYFALDVTDPTTVTDDASAASNFMWEFRNPDLGYTFGRATIVKTRAFGGQWLVVVPSGYNNASGEGKLFFLRASDGVLVKTMATGTGTPGNPSGLAHATGYTKDYRNQVAEQFYAGDLFGNVWRFDVSSSNEASWKVEQFAELRDGGGAPQPITTPVRVDVDVSNGVDRWVFVGTGKLTHQCDLVDYAADPANAVECAGNPSPTQNQAMYAMRDGTYDTPKPMAAPYTRSDLDVLPPGVPGLGSGIIAKNGWLQDLPPGQRIVRSPVAAVGLIAYVATSQPIDPCETGMPANIYVRQFGNGESRLQSGSSFVESIYDANGAAGIEVIATDPPGCTSDCIPIIKLAVLSSAKSELFTFEAKLPGVLGSARLSWRTLGQ